MLVISILYNGKLYERKLAKKSSWLEKLPGLT
jgi:hypothetical protein